MANIEPNSEKWLNLRNLPNEEWRDISSVYVLNVDNNKYKISSF